MERQYADMIDIQERLRALVDSARIPVQLDPDPLRPETVDQLADALAVIRDNLTKVQAQLNTWDFHLNGPEVRPAAQIRADIDADTRVLKRPDLREGRAVKDIEGNIGYDWMQLNRN